jgi:signal peptidase II
VWFFLTVFTAIFLSDRIFKTLVFENLSLGVSYPILEGVLHITPVQNKGVAFGLFANSGNAIFVSLVFFMLVLALYFISIKRPRSILLLSGIFLVFSGAAGNLADRIFYGYVLDFIDFRIWPVFNIADSAITIGAFLIFLYIFNDKKGQRIKGVFKARQHIIRRRFP